VASGERPRLVEGRALHRSEGKGWLGKGGESGRASQSAEALGEGLSRRLFTIRGWADRDCVTTRFRLRRLVRLTAASVRSGERAMMREPRVVRLCSTPRVGRVLRGGAERGEG
jgi:hypothetical protein